MKPDPHVGSEEAFEAFEPIEPPNGEALWDHKDTLGYDLHQVWTVVDDGGETECWYAEPGYHIVNVMGYMVTRKPWSDEALTFYWYFDDRDPYVVVWSNGDEEVVFADDEADARERAWNDDGVTIVSITLDDEDEGYDDGKVLIAGILYDKQTGQEADPQ